MTKHRKFFAPDNGSKDGRKDAAHHVVDQPENGSVNGRGVKKHLQCPACFNGLGGVGKEKWWRRINATVVRRCYTCDQCGANWTVKVRTVSVVEGMEMELIEDGGDHT